MSGSQLIFHKQKRETGKEGKEERGRQKEKDRKRQSLWGLGMYYTKWEKSIRGKKRFYLEWKIEQKKL